jgi:excisionase family DNA binding protein
MSTHVLEFAELSEQDLTDASLVEIERGDRLEILVRQPGGTDRKLALPQAAGDVVATVLTHLLRGERIAVLTEDQELSPNEAASILGFSRPLVVHRMESGDLPFHYVGKHRRTRLKDVLALKRTLEAERSALDALAVDTESLIRDHGL